MPWYSHALKLFDYYNKIAANQPCGTVVLGNLCFDDIGQSWTIYSSIGCILVLCLLAVILIAIHSLISLYALIYKRNVETDFLVGAEEGCCGILAIGFAFWAQDGTGKAKSGANQRRVFSRILTLGIQIPILVVVSSALLIVSRPSATQQEKTSILLLIVVLTLHVASGIENVYDGLMAVFST